MSTVIENGRRCGFCEQYECHVTHLIAGPSGYICDECVEKASQLLAARRAAKGAASGDALRMGVDEDGHASTLIRKHFHPASTGDLVTSSRVFPARMRADLQKALEERLGGAQGRSFFGVHIRHAYETPRFADLLDDSEQTIAIAPPRYEEVDVGECEPVKCLENGLWLLEDHGIRYAVLLAPRWEYGRLAGSSLEVAVLGDADGARITAGVFKSAEEALKEARSYRGKVLSLESANSYTGQAVAVRVHRLDAVRREDLVLTEPTVRLLERNVIGFARQRSELARYGATLKKGLLFYGPPGTGKTYTIRYLASELPHHTTLLMTADQVALIKEYIALARLLQPSMIVIEDADLIARKRESMSTTCEESILNRLLNEMDGLAEDAEMFFVLTTNRPEMIEAAVAGRPGRIDQAIEFPLPDEPSRLKLARIYARGAPVSEATLALVARRTRNSSAAFIKELMRRATQVHLENGGNEITREVVDEALNEMVFTGGRLNVKLLGGSADVEEP